MQKNIITKIHPEYSPWQNFVKKYNNQLIINNPNKDIKYEINRKLNIQEQNNLVIDGFYYNNEYYLDDKKFKNFNEEQLKKSFTDIFNYYIDSLKNIMIHNKNIKLDLFNKEFFNNENKKTQYINDILKNIKLKNKNMFDAYFKFLLIDYLPTKKDFELLNNNYEQKEYDNLISIINDFYEIYHNKK